MKKVSLLPYLTNVRNSIFHNVKWFLEHVEGEKEDIEAERFLQAVIDYCTRLIDDPSKRVKKRVRTSHGSGRNRKVV